MKISDIERQIINTVVQRFLNLWEATPRRALIRMFRNVDALENVARGPFFSHSSHNQYTPMPFALEYCGNDESLTKAKQATEIALRVLQNLDEAHPEKDEQGFTLQEFLDHAVKMFERRPEENVLLLGLYFAQYFNVFSSWGGQPSKPGVITSFHLLESIVTIDPAQAWKQYIEKIRNDRAQSTNNGSPASRAGVFSSAFQDYTFVRSIGSGGSGTVLEVLDAEGQRFALKALRPNVPHAKIKRFKNELHFCLKPPSDRIVRVLDYGKTDEGSPFYVMPLYAKTLRDRIKEGVPAADVLPLYGQILDGIEAAHRSGVHHRDVKPENILFDPAVGLVVADFGIAHFQEDQLLTSIETGTNERLANFAYAAPEQRFPGGTVDQRADIYSLGLVLNEMYTKQVPHGTGFRLIGEVAPEYGYLDAIVDTMIQQQPSQRPQSINQIKEELIGRGNEFIRLQRLDALKQQAVPETDIDDRIVNDPIRVVGKIDYDKGILLLRLNQTVNREFEECFTRRASRFTANPSGAIISFQGDIARVIVTEHFLQQGVNFLKEYLVAANEEYGAQVRKGHQQRLESQRAALRAAISEVEAKARVLQKVTI